MKILVVEDDENKRNQLLSFLNENYRDIDVECAFSVISAVRSLKRTSFDLILLDMTLPNYDLDNDGAGGGMHAFGGEEILRQMKRIQRKSPVIVVTQFETFGEPPNEKNLVELDRELRTEFRDNYIGSVYYHASIHDWISFLQNQINATLKL